jgi:hypothetical protein
MGGHHAATPRTVRAAVHGGLRRSQRNEDDISDSDSEDSTTEGEDITQTTDDVCISPAVPASPAALLEWLESGEYATWQAESGPHASTGPHFGAVRTFVDPCLAESLEAGSATHPLGAATVKELFGDGDAVLGWSVMIKVADGSGGDTWYWHENYDGTTYADEVGSGLCTGCHGGRGNVDYFLSPWPLQ